MITLVLLLALSAVLLMSLALVKFAPYGNQPAIKKSGKAILVLIGLAALLLVLKTGLLVFHAIH